MLHVRVVSPAALTGRLADQLTATRGVQNLVVQPGAATRPDGDAVQFDMHDEAANPVFRTCEASDSIGPARSAWSVLMPRSLIMR